MIILGITHPISWNPAACLLIDGKLVAFSEEERFIRLKHAPNVFPEMAIKACLEKAGVNPHNIEATAIGFSRPDERNICSIDAASYLSGALSEERLFEYHTSLALLNADSRIKPYGNKMYFDHHLCHAASAAIPSGFEETNVLTLDGWGGDSSGLLGTFNKDSGFQTYYNISPYNSWGITYELITEYLGFRCHSGEGKTMGLASYGKVDSKLLPSFCEPEFGLPDVRKYEQYLKSHFSPRPPSAELEVWHQNMAATLQSYYEHSLIRIAETLAKRSRYKRYVLAGGVTLNCSGNGRLAEQDFVDDLFIQPASHDAGTALGAAILAHRELSGAWPDVNFSHAYWGQSFSDSEIKQALDFARIPYQHCDPSQMAAEALAKNEVVGWFQGAAEVGPRALGNRSILAHPGHPANLDRVNQQVKRREKWRPLAPSVLAEKYFDVFNCRHLSPYMLLAAQVNTHWKDKLSAIVHIDGSARPQSVMKETNPKYHQLIQNFENMTGLPVVLNTSFNLDDEPLVNSPENAIATFFRSGVETLVIGSYVIRKKWLHET